MMYTAILCLIVLAASIPTNGERSVVDLKPDSGRDTRDGIPANTNSVEFHLQGRTYSLVSPGTPVPWSAAYAAAEAADSTLLIVRDNPEAETILEGLNTAAQLADLDVSASWLGDEGSVQDTHLAIEWRGIGGEFNLMYTGDEVLYASYVTYSSTTRRVDEDR